MVRLFGPLGIDASDAWNKQMPLDGGGEFAEAAFGWGTDPQQIPLGPFGLRLSAPNLLVFGQLYLDHGRWHGRQVVPAAWVDRSVWAADGQPGYVLLWRSHQWAGHRVLVARGTDGHLIAISPERRAVVAVTGTNGAGVQIDDEALFPLIDEVILPALG